MEEINNEIVAPGLFVLTVIGTMVSLFICAGIAPICTVNFSVGRGPGLGVGWVIVGAVATGVGAIIGVGVGMGVGNALAVGVALISGVDKTVGVCCGLGGKLVTGVGADGCVTNPARRLTHTMLEIKTKPIAMKSTL